MTSNPAPQVLAVDIGGTKIAGALVDTAGGLSDHLVVPTPREEGLGDPGLRATTALIDQLMTAAQTRGDAPVAIGVGLPEYVAEDGTVRTREIIGWERQPREQLGAFGVPVTLESDVRAAGAAEAIFGAGSDQRSCVYVSVGTGISYCLVENGTARAGSGGAAIALGELEVSGAVDPAGHPWTLEAFASGSGLTQRYNQETGRTAAGAAAVAEAAASGDEVARLRLGEAGDALGAGIATLVHLLDPDVVVIGGGLGLAGGTFLEHCLAGLRSRLKDRGAPRHLPVRAAALGTGAGVVGAALAAYRQRGSPIVTRDAAEQPRPLTTIHTGGRAPARRDSP
jgi:glucokinase